MGERAQEYPATETAEAAEQATDLAVALARMGGVLLSAETVETALGLVTALAAQAIPGSVGAGVSLFDSRGGRTTAASDPLVEQADAVQYRLDAGPCLTAWRDRAVVRIDDVAAETRWAQWTSAVTELGIAAVLSTPLIAGPEAIGAIKVYARRTHAFDAHSTRLLQLFAQQAAILLANTQTVAEARQLAGNLTAALRSRDVIGQAKGILITQGAPDEEAAFTMLAASSQRSNVKVYEVAQRLVAATVQRTGHEADKHRPASPPP